MEKFYSYLAQATSTPFQNSASNPPLLPFSTKRSRGSRNGLIGACLSASLLFTLPLSAQQVFTPQSGAGNPLNGIDIGGFATPTFTDVDLDGDMDLLVGDIDGTIVYYQNTGTATNPVYTLQFGGPFIGIDVSDHSSPSYVDIDGDGDKDLISGDINGNIHYYRNTGTSAAPVLVEQTGVANPFNGLNTGNFSKPQLVDIDKDGDLDLFVGEISGTTSFYRNTGTATAPVFALQAGALNPLNGLNVSGWASPAFVDFDGDGDQDLVIGANNSVINYYKNTGTATAPVFVQQGGAANPFGGISTFPYASPAFVDLTSDGLIDLVIGTQDGTMGYYQNTSSLPLQLISFTGSNQSGHNQLNWQTAQEINTKSFDVEASSDGVIYSTIATVKAAGSGNNSYTAKDDVARSTKTYYRLKMIDADGRYTYSAIIWIGGETANTVSVYPNPAMSVLNLNIGNAKLLKTTAGIYDAGGRLQKNVQILNQQQQINVQSLPRGMYMIRFANGAMQSFTKN